MTHWAWHCSTYSRSDDTFRMTKSTRWVSDTFTCRFFLYLKRAADGRIRIIWKISIKENRLDINAYLVVTLFSYKSPSDLVTMVFRVIALNSSERQEFSWESWKFFWRMMHINNKSKRLKSLRFRFSLEVLKSSTKLLITEEFDYTNFISEINCRILIELIK